jgi:hypothetical protein
MSVSKIRALEIAGIIFNVIATLAWVLGFWPGMLTGDSIASLYQILIGPYYDWHPIAYTLFVEVFSFGGTYIWMISIVQSLLLSTSVYYFMTSIFSKISRLSAIWITGILQATPFMGGLSVTMWKDIPYTAFLLFGLGALIRSANPNKLKLFTAGLFLVISSVFRHEAPYVLFLLTLIYLLIKSKSSTIRHWKVPATFLIAAVISLFLSSVLVAITSAIPAPKFTKTLALQRDLAALAFESPSSLPKDTYQQLREISSDRGWERSIDCWTPIDYINPTDFNYEKANKFSEKVISSWLDVATSKELPRLLGWHKCFVKPFIPFPIQPTPDPVVISWLTPGVSSNTLDIDSAPKLGIFQNVMNRYVDFWVSISKFASWPGLHFSLLIVFLTYAYKNFHLSRQTLKLLLSFIVARQTMLLILTPSYDARYAMQTTLISVIFLLYFLEKISKKLIFDLRKKR